MKLYWFDARRDVDRLYSFMYIKLKVFYHGSVCYICNYKFRNVSYLTMELYHTLDGVTNLEYNLLCF